MNQELLSFLLFSLTLVISCTCLSGRPNKNEQIIFRPLSYEEASQKADSMLALMTLDEKISLLGGDKSFFIQVGSYLIAPYPYAR